jgi:hypothetical protein
MWTEIIFNISYLVIIWSLVITMITKFKRVDYRRISTAKCFLWAYFLLALGDTGHVGFRAYAYIAGGIEKHSELVGIGTLTTAVTVTIFYVLMIFVWKNRYNKNIGLVCFVLIAAAIARLAILFMPQNDWSSIVPPFTWSLYRNIPLMIQGIGAAFLILYEAVKHKDNSFKWIGIMILVSYACYIPVILLVQNMPLIGMLMIPKTIAYLAAAFIGYNILFIKGR